MASEGNNLIDLLRNPESGATAVKARLGSVASTSPVIASADGVQIYCRQISGQTLSVGQPCVLLTFGIGSKPLLVQTA